MYLLFPLFIGVVLEMRFLILLCVLSAGLVTTSEVRAATVFTVSLDGLQADQGNGTGSTATGFGTLVLNEAQTRLTMDLTITGLDFLANGGTDTGANNVTALHIHRAPAGLNGPVVFGLIGPNSDTTGDLTITPFLGGATIFSAWDTAEGNNTTLAAELSNLSSDGLYFNVHSNVFGGGEIRGQIVAVPEPASCVLLSLAGLGVVAQKIRRRRSKI